MSYLNDAVAFLVDPKVRQSPPSARVGFLRKKGLGLFDIERAAEKVKDEATVKYIGGNYKALSEGAAPPVVPNVVFTVEELRKHDGLEGRELFLGCKGVVYRVDPSFYGEGMAYNAFAGSDASRHLAKVKVGTTELNQTYDDLTEKQMKVLDDWEAKYRQKYTLVGRVDVAQFTAPAEPAAADSSSDNNDGDEGAPETTGGGGMGCAQQ